MSEEKQFAEFSNMTYSFHMVQRKAGKIEHAAIQIKPHHIFLFALFVSVLFFSAGFLFLQSQITRVKQNKVLELESIARLKINQIVQWKEQLVREAMLIAADPILMEYTNTLIKEPNNKTVQLKLKERLSQLKKRDEISAIYLLDSHAKVITGSSMENPALPNSEYLLSEIASNAFQLERIMVGKLHVSNLNENPHIDLIVPIFSEKYLPHHAIIIQIDASVVLYPLLQYWPIPSKSSETLLVEREGDSVVFLNTLRFSKNRPLEFKLPLENIQIPAVRAAFGMYGFFEGVDYRSVPVLSYILPVPDSTWSMVAKLDSKEVFSEIRSLAIYVLFVVMLAILTTLSLLWVYVSRQKVRVHELNLEIRKTEEKFKIIFDTANVGKSIIWLDGTIFANKKFCEMLGYPEEELKRKTWQEIVPAEQIPPMNLFMQKLLSGDMSNARFEQRYIRKDGSMIWADVSIAIFRDDQNEPQYFITTMVDITKQKEAELQIKLMNEELESRVRDRTAQLQAAYKEMEAFAYSASHDLHSPLRSVTSYSELLAQSSEGMLTSESQHYLQRIRHAAGKMTILIDNLLKLSRLSSKEMIYETFNISEPVQNAVDELKESVKERNVEFHIQPGMPYIKADRDLINILFENLIGNAVKYTSKKEKSVIEIGYSDSVDDPGSPVFFVKDNGVGFDMKYADKIFMPFQRLHNDAEFPGIGIGLSIVQRIIIKHGGRIWFKADPENGATFFFTLSGALLNT